MDWKRMTCAAGALAAAGMLSGGAMAQEAATPDIGTARAEVENAPKHVSGVLLPPRPADFGDEEAPFPDGSLWWDNGECGEPAEALFSQIGPGGFFQLVADDFLLTGDWFEIETVTVQMLVSDNVTPDVGLRFFSDCNGKPDEILDEFDAVNVTPLGAATVPAWAGLMTFTVYEVEFRPNVFVEGPRRLWLSPFGKGTGMYYWLGANDGLIQGVQGQLQLMEGGMWKDAEQCSSCGVVPCSDYCFDIEGRICMLLKDNREPDFTKGVASAGLTQDSEPILRAADNFQLPPGQLRKICRLELWFATNCPPDETYLELYANDCADPVLESREVLLDSNDEVALPFVIDTGEVLPSPNGFGSGLPIYKLVWTDIAKELEPGRNYWISPVAELKNQPGGQGAWILRQIYDCGDESLYPGGHICITEGQYLDIFFGIPDFIELSSDPPLGGMPKTMEPRDFAFVLWLDKRYFGAGAAQQPPGGDPVTPGRGGGSQMESEARELRF